MENTAIIKELLGMEAFATATICEFEKLKQRCYLLRRGLEDSSSASAGKEDPEIAEANAKARMGLRKRTYKRTLK